LLLWRRGKEAEREREGGRGREGSSCVFVMKTGGNGWRNPISTFVSIFFGENGSGFEKCGFKNGIRICGHTETDKYGWGAEKLN
jgi:hypothetical protein